MRLILTALLLSLAPPGAAARDCVASFPAGMDERPSREFYRCVAAELRDLKRRQAELEALVAGFERVIAALPVDYINDNGEIAVEEGRRIGRAVFRLDSALLGGATSLPVAQEVMEGLCAGRGCRLVLIHRQTGRRGAPAAGAIAGPCRFAYDPETRAWLRGPGCGGGAGRGVDGPGGDAAEIVAEAGPCLLADAASRRAVGVESGLLRRDRAPGLHLVAAPGRGGGEGRFRCELEIGAE